eukprot:CAMPEP_0205826744 /NCGR_PEP_ID=MMETSP0206-20130828/29711_1 /ASSEMBLY_ACC=CAM_ASM_000279 /TAXON_ID=36767 /ORGANISM="Euplotes focardii, Strain TN1" /LENGTH=371 /DNA_ID=CAMNT_0053126951 /DNA_START=30 /DNA_END=1146 /DNA_ORIENTATION=+
MSDENNTGNTKIESFLGAPLESYPNFCFKSPQKTNKEVNIESLPLSCRRTPIMSPIGAKFDFEKVIIMEKTEIKNSRRSLKFTPLKDNHLGTNPRFSSADKIKSTRDIFRKCNNKSIDNNSKEEKEPIDYEVAQVSQSAEKIPRKFISKIKQNSHKKKKQLERSPLIPNTKHDGGLLSEESSDLENNMIQDFDNIQSSKTSNFSPRKALDFAEGCDPPFLSPEFNKDMDSSEVYTPSFEHKNEDFRKQSPLSLINQFKDPSHKRRNKFKQRYEDAPYLGHLVMNREGQQVLQPMHNSSHRGMSMPPPMFVGRQLGFKGESEEDKEKVAPMNYYPTCNCQKNVFNIPITLTAIIMPPQISSFHQDLKTQKNI